MEKETLALHELTDILRRTDDPYTPFWLVKKCVGYIIKDLSYDQLVNMARIFYDRFILNQAEKCAAIGKSELSKRIMMHSEIVTRAKDIAVNDTTDPVISSQEKQTV